MQDSVEIDRSHLLQIYENKIISTEANSSKYFNCVFCSKSSSDLFLKCVRDTKSNSLKINTVQVIREAIKLKNNC